MVSFNIFLQILIDNQTANQKDTCNLKKTDIVTFYLFDLMKIHFVL